MQSLPASDLVRSDCNAKVFVFGVIFLNALRTGLLIPVLPRLIQALTVRGPEASSLENGLLLVAYAGMAFLLSPFLGSLADRLGRRLILLLAAARTLLYYALCDLANTLGVLLLARVLAGAFGASTSVANAAFIDLTPPEQRTRTFGLSSAVLGLGLILGPVIGSSVMTFGLRVPFIAACALVACEFCFGLFWFTETLRTPFQRLLSIADVNPLASIQRPGQLPFSNSLLVGFVFFQLGGSITQSVLVDVLPPAAGLDRTRCRAHRRTDSAGRKHPSRDFWKCCAQLRKTRPQWNPKRIYRVYKAMKLNLRRLPKRERVALYVPRLPDMVWSIDFMRDALACGRRLLTFNVVNDFNRQAIHIEVDTSITSARLMRIFEQIKSDHGLPQVLRLDQHLFACLEDLREEAYGWMVDYNEQRPHELLGNLTPAEYRQYVVSGSTFKVPA